MDDNKNIYPILQNLTEKNHVTYIVPENYFDSINDKIIGRIAQDEVKQEIKTMFPGLQSVEKLHPYSYPHNYFSSVNKSVFDKINPPKTALHRFVLNNHWRRLAVAAIIIGIFIFSALFIIMPFRKTGTVPAIVENRIEKMSDEQLQFFMNADTSIYYKNITNSNIDYNQIFQPFTDKELKDFLETTSDNNEDLLLN